MATGQGDQILEGGGGATRDSRVIGPKIPSRPLPRSPSQWQGEKLPEDGDRPWSCSMYRAGPKRVEKTDVKRRAVAVAVAVARAQIRCYAGQRVCICCAIPTSVGQNFVHGYVLGALLV